MKNYYFLALVFLILGCNPFQERQNLTKLNMSKANDVANLRVKRHRLTIRKMKDYKAYRYLQAIQDPFRVKSFLAVEQKAIAQANQPKCLPPKCIAPKPRKKMFLEHYALSDLSFVGTMSSTDKGENIALIMVPDIGIVRIGKGEYLGRNNGKVIAVNETTVVLQEKLFKSGLWEDRKTVLMINN